jgi:chemotaxis protein MotB
VRGRLPPRRGGHSAHQDDWLLSYADTITLLLCLFAVLLAHAVAHHSPDRAANRSASGAASASSGAARPVVADAAGPETIVEPIRVKPPAMLFVYRRDAGPDFVSPDFAGPAPEGPAPEAGAEDGTDDPHGDRAVLAAPAATAAAAPAPRAEEAPDRGPPNDSVAAPVLAAPVLATVDTANAAVRLIASPALAERLQSLGTPAIEQGGAFVRTVQISSAAFFGTGFATLSDEGKAILRDVAANLRSPRFDGYLITVEGHTDDVPIRSTAFPSNWELSTARAAAVVHFLIDDGIPAIRLRAAGYADTFPVVPNRDEAGRPVPENQARNRRVVIRLDKTEPHEGAM